MTGNELLNLLVADPERTSAIAAVSGVLVAIITVFIATISIYVSLKTIKIQDNHNRLSVKPLPRIAFHSNDHNLILKINNNGFGPMIVSNFCIVDNDEVSVDIVKFLPDPPSKVIFKGTPSFIGDGAVVGPGDSMPIIEIEFHSNCEETFKFRESIEAAIQSVKIQFDYTDVYENKYPACSRRFFDEIGNNQ